MSRPVITFLSDYGLADDFVGVCHGVIAGIAPEAIVIDLSHGVPAHDVMAGALMLEGSLPFMPPGIHLAVVDPDVGAARRAVALRTAGEPERVLVGPDNGLLMLAAQTLGGIAEAAEISRSPARLQPVSATFHGRDLFAPVAARLAAGALLAELGDPLEPEELVRLELPSPVIAPGRVLAHVIYADRFGNVQLDVTHEQLGGSGLRLGRPVTVTVRGVARQAHFGRTFADVAEGELLVYEDAHRRLALAVSHGSAQRLLGLAPTDPVAIEATA